MTARGAREIEMNSKMYEVPAEMRDFADRSVAQARKAFDGFMGAVQKTSQSVDTSAFPPAAAARDMSAKAVGFAQSNVNAAFDVAQKLVHAKDFQEVVAIQTEFLKAQMEALQAQSRELGTAIQNAATPKK